MTIIRISVRTKELEGEFRGAMESARADLANGRIAHPEFEQRGQEAVAAFNRGILAELRRGLAG